LEYKYIKSVGGDYNGRSWSETRNYSTSWSQGGPIIEREKITVGPCDTHDKFRAYAHAGCYAIPKPRFTQDGPTPLIAAMRCYVASKLGDEVEIPKELIKSTEKKENK
jgi:hypothetical protein